MKAQHMIDFKVDHFREWTKAAIGESFSPESFEDAVEMSEAWMLVNYGKVNWDRMMSSNGLFFQFYFKSYGDNNVVHIDFKKPKNDNGGFL